MPPTKFWLNMIWKFSRRPPSGPSQISDQNNFSNSEPLSFWCCQSSLGSTCITVWEEMSFEEFQDGHLRCWNGMYLAVLNLHVSPMPPTKFQLNPIYRSGEDVFSRFSRWPLSRPSWISEWNDFSWYESLYCSDASHLVSIQSDLRFGRRCRLEIFKMAQMATILDIGMEWF